MRKINVTKLNAKQTAMLGALLGDALGVPHEFRSAHSINRSYIDHPSKISDAYRTYSDTELGVYSDDFSQMLCVNKNFSSGMYHQDTFYADLLEWEEGKYWVDNYKFDEGLQTISQLKNYRRFGTVKIHDPTRSGNGSLMRVLPIAFIATSEEELYRLTDECGFITHNSFDTLQACKFYNLVARWVSQHKEQTGGDIELAKEFFTQVWDLTAERMDWTPDRQHNNFGNGYVIDSLNMVRDCIENTDSFNDAIKRAILYGLDTDTNASIVGGIAALVFGLENVNPEWMEFIKPSLRNQYVRELFAE